MKVVLTGGTGFLGKALSLKLRDNSYELLLAQREKICEATDQEQIVVGGIDGSTDWVKCLKGCDIVIHCAAFVHRINRIDSQTLDGYRVVNTEGTQRLAKQAIEAGVKRFVFISSVKVMGESTSYGCKFTNNDELKPEDSYGKSKAEAERILLELGESSDMEVTIIRPALVYGAGVKANFLNLLKLSSLPLPLPFSAIDNRRSMIYLENLVDLIITCANHPNAANRVFFASDGDDLSLSRLVCLIRKSMGRRALLFPLPKAFFDLIGKVTKKKELIDRLVGNLQVDNSCTKKYLNWSAPYTVEQGIRKTVDHFKSNLQSK